MPNFFYKDPDAALDYKIDWSGWLDGDTISNSSWTVPDGITKDYDSASDTVAFIWLSGGTGGAAYTLVNHIETASGRKDDRTITISIQEK